MARWIAVIVTMMLCANLSGQSCIPHWSDEFYPSGTDAQVQCMAVFDDGHGPRLYIGGSFQRAGRDAAAGLARWDGTALTPIAGAPISDIESMLVFDDGSGPSLFITGEDGTFAWNGSMWRQLGEPYIFRARLLVSHDPGTGPALFAIGRVGFDPAVARWTGATWEPMGGPFDFTGTFGPQLKCLASVDSGNGPHLYVGGQFTSIGGQAIVGLSSWDGAAWRQVGQGLQSVYNHPNVWGIVAYDDGSGVEPWVGISDGAFPQYASGLARFDGASWHAINAANPIGGGPMIVAPTRSGPRIVVAGRLQTADGHEYSVGMWDGSNWVPVGNPNSLDAFPEPRSLVAFDDGAGSSLFVGGQFGTFADAQADSIAAWNGSAWAPLVAGQGLDYPAYTLAWFDDGHGPAMYAGGHFVFAGGQRVSGLARWDGQRWSPADTRFRGQVYALATFDDGRGTALFVAGSFGGDIPELPAGVGVARWDGTTWEFLPSPVAPAAGWPKLSVADDPVSPALFIGGDFTGVVAQWDGSQFRTLPGLIDNGEPGVSSFAYFREGGVPILYVGGLSIEIAGVPGDHSLVRWDGQAWSAAMFDPRTPVDSLLVTHGPGGDILYAGGEFYYGNTSPPINGLAAWDGTTWSQVGNLSANTNVRNLTFMDDGSGPGLIAAGTFYTSSQNFSGCAKWDGQTWTRLGTAAAGGGDTLLAVDGPSGPSLFAIGSPGGINRWVGCRPGSCYANCDGSTGSNGNPTLSAADFMCFLNLFASGDPNANCDHSTNAPLLNVNDFICFLNRFAAGCP